MHKLLTAGIASTALALTLAGCGEDPQAEVAVGTAPRPTPP